MQPVPPQLGQTDPIGRLLDAVYATAARGTETARSYLTDRDMATVRTLRVEQGLTWRQIARRFHEEWGAEWTPADNTIVGRAICAVAAGSFGEDPGRQPWN